MTSALLGKERTETKIVPAEARPIALALQLKGPATAMGMVTVMAGAAAWALDGRAAVGAEVIFRQPATVPPFVASPRALQNKYRALRFLKERR